MFWACQLLVEILRSPVYYKRPDGLGRPVRLAYQPPLSSTFLSEQISHQQSASSTFLSEQTSTSQTNRLG
jgi:hypothetical protein